MMSWTSSVSASTSATISSSASERLSMVTRFEAGDLDEEEEVQETEEDSVVEVSFYLNHLVSFHLFVFRWIWWRKRRKIRALPGILYLCLNFCNFF